MCKLLEEEDNNDNNNNYYIIINKMWEDCATSISP